MPSAMQATPMNVNEPLPCITGLAVKPRIIRMNPPAIRIDAGFFAIMRIILLVVITMTPRTANGFFRRCG